MKLHFIAIGGSAMHNLAIALQKKGFNITGSDDEIFEPSKSRLAKYNLLPEQLGWDTNKIKDDLDAIILGMHAKPDNPELKKAKEKGIKIYSYPEYIYEQSKNKTRVVIGGSHGKTTITSMVMHVLKFYNKNFDYMVGAKLDGFDTMVQLTDDAPLIILEGDEYLSSPIDKRPKFHLYHPHIASISGIAWDHINVFPTFEEYKKQFEIFIEKIEENGTLIYFKDDKHISNMISTNQKIKKIPYSTHSYEIINNQTFLISTNKKIPISIFGQHNMQNCNAAKLICNEIGITDEQFYNAINSFSGAAKRLELLAENKNTSIFFDFAHAPSKLEATIKAVKEKFPKRALIACMELHTYSSLSENFLSQYKNTMDDADIALIYFNPKAIELKKLKKLSEEKIKSHFFHKNSIIFSDIKKLINHLYAVDFQNKTLLLMSSGNFSNFDFKNFSTKIIKKSHNIG